MSALPGTLITGRRCAHTGVWPYLSLCFLFHSSLVVAAAWCGRAPCLAWHMSVSIQHGRPLVPWETDCSAGSCSGCSYVSVCVVEPRAFEALTLQSSVKLHCGLAVRPQLIVWPVIGHHSLELLLWLFFLIALYGS